MEWLPKNYDHRLLKKRQVGRPRKDDPLLISQKKAIDQKVRKKNEIDSS